MYASLRAVVACFVGAGWLPQFGRADTYDIGVKLFTDINCMFWAEDFVILDGGCYANKWSPNATKGFRMNIVYFNDPQKIDMREFVDDCHNLAMPKRTMSTGADRCSPFLGSLYAQFDIRFRSNVCKGSMCSNLAIAVQTFYTQASCNGMASAIFRYPVQGECLRANNGTQALIVSSDDSNISLSDYGGSDDCKVGNDVRLRTYSITNRNCYPLYSTASPRSFSWVVERTEPYAAASGGYRSLPWLFTIAAYLMSLMSLRQPDPQSHRGG